IARQGGSFRVAHALHATGPEARRRRIDEMRSRDRAACERVERMMRNEELMSAKDDGRLADDSPEVRASEDGVVWEGLTAKTRLEPSVEPEGGGHAGRSGA